MSFADVTDMEMHANELTTKLMAEVDDVGQGSALLVPDDVCALVSDLLRECATTPAVQPNSSLAEFLNVTSLPQTPTAMPAGPLRSKKMLAGLGAFVATTVGKMVLGTAIAAASVGGAHAANIIDVPGLPDDVVDVMDLEIEPALVASGPVEADAAPADEGPDDEAPADDESVEDDETTEDDESVEDDAAPAAAADDDTASHGETVSDFATTTDLEGCERGQAIAELASSKAADHRQNNERTTNCNTEDDPADNETAAEAPDAVEDEVPADDGAEDDDTASHGETVSDFATTTDLEGCERGQAIAELASSKAADHRQNNERTTNCNTEDDPADNETAVEAPDAVEDEEAADDEAGDDSAEDDEADAGGRPENAGPPEGAGRPDGAGRPAKD